MFDLFFYKARLFFCQPRPEVKREFQRNGGAQYNKVPGAFEQAQGRGKMIALGAKLSTCTKTRCLPLSFPPLFLLVLFAFITHAKNTIEGRILQILVLGFWDKNTGLRRRHAISPVLYSHYRDLGISSRKMHDSAYNIILSVVILSV